MAPIPPDCFLNDCESLGAFNGKKRWRSSDGRKLYEFDELHSEVEVYNRRGKHIAVVDITGQYSKPAVGGRTIDV